MLVLLVLLVLLVIVRIDPHLIWYIYIFINILKIVSDYLNLHNYSIIGTGNVLEANEPNAQLRLVSCFILYTGFILYIQWKIIINNMRKAIFFLSFFFFVLYISKYMSAISFFFLLINRIIFRKDVIETGYKTEKDIKRRREEKGIAPEEKKITVENFKWRGLIAFYIYIYRWWVKMDIVQRERERCLVMVAAAAVVFFS